MGDGTTVESKINSLGNNNEFIDRLPAQIQSWALNSYDSGTPTPEELKTYMTANSSEIYNFLARCNDNGTILMSNGIQSTADRKSYSCMGYIVQFLYVYDNGDYDYDNSILNIVFEGISGGDTKVQSYDSSWATTTYSYNGFIISHNERTNTWKWNETDYQGGGSSGGGGLACFTGDTLIHSEHGLLPIKDLQVGDKVWSLDKNGIEELKPIVKTFNHEVDTIYHIETEKDIIESSWSHPFYVIDKGEILAKDLSIQDKLLSKDRKKMNIIKYSVNKTHDTTVYEIGVQDNHNYFVGENGVLVYNEPIMIEKGGSK